MAASYLACTVRGCGAPLERRSAAFVCPSGHTFDLARSGYVNLLQPQDRRSLLAGDARPIVEARTRLLEAGIGRSIVDGMVERAAALELGRDAVVVDLGAGAGDLIGTLAAGHPIAGAGIDISTAAAGHAARRFPHLTWIVANADRRLPLIDGQVQLLLSLHARRNPDECARVLSEDGFLLVAVPAADDLMELRAAVGGERVPRGRVETLIAEHQSRFRVVSRSTLREHHRLERQPLVDLLRVTYRGERRSAAGRVEALDRLDVTLASDLVLFAAKRHPA